MSVGTSLAPLVEQLNRTAGRRTIAAAESCTAGLVMAVLADLADASERFRGGVVAYSTADKSDVLGVGEYILQEHGTVSAECAAGMATRVREMFRSDVGLSVTGVAGPSTQEGKPVGLVYVAVSLDGRTAVREHRFTGGRAANRIAAVEAVLELAAETLKAG